MDIEKIVRLLQNSGIRVIGSDPQFIYIEDPSCILRGFDTFLEYAWIAAIFVTMLLLSGWAVSMLRGAKNDIFTNLRNLILIFGTLSIVGPIMTAIWGRDFIARGCKTVNVSMAEVNKILDMRNQKLKSRNQDDLWEEIDIFDSGALLTDEEADNEPIKEIIQPDLEHALNGVNGANGVNGVNGARYGFSNADPVNPNSPIHATIAGKDVIYHYADQTKIRKTDGSGTWRNNNQGNISYGKFAINAGALAKHGRWAVFPTQQDGMTAIKRLLKSDSYKNLSIAGAISRWAPPVENDTKKYQNDLARITKLDISRKVSSLSDEELSRVANAIKTIEGFTVGREIKE